MVREVLNDTIRTSHRDINEKWMSKYGLYSLMENDSILQSDTTLKVFYDSCHDSNMGILHRASALLTNESDGKTLADISDYADALSTLTPVNKTEENWLEVLNILTENILDSSGIDSNEIVTLRAIAELCPNEEGFGVYMARSALLEVDTLPNFAGFNECEASPIPPSELKREEIIHQGTVPQIDDYRLYPNPNKGTFTLEYFPSKDEQLQSAKLLILDLTGHLVFNSDISFSSNKCTINSNDLANGSFLVKVLVGGEMKLISKIVILK
ncbi:MAG: T9SS type A sorting domain-containing protein [Bacteroidia bacterium]|nr:T9SS type A sorting domain-containing protein [Bacteroidia bacterium]